MKFIYSLLLFINMVTPFSFDEDYPVPFVFPGSQYTLSQAQIDKLDTIDGIYGDNYIWYSESGRACYVEYTSLTDSSAQIVVPAYCVSTSGNLLDYPTINVNFQKSNPNRQIWNWGESICKSSLLTNVSQLKGCGYSGGGTDPKPDPTPTPSVGQKQYVFSFPNTFTEGDVEYLLSRRGTYSDVVVYTGYVESVLYGDSSLNDNNVIGSYIMTQPVLIAYPITNLSKEGNQYYFDFADDVTSVWVYMLPVSSFSYDISNSNTFFPNFARNLIPQQGIRSLNTSYISSVEHNTYLYNFVFSQRYDSSGDGYFYLNSYFYGTPVYVYDYSGEYTTDLSSGINVSDKGTSGAINDLNDSIVNGDSQSQSATGQLNDTNSQLESTIDHTDRL